jgi:amino acid transporter
MISDQLFITNFILIFNVMENTNYHRHKSMTTNKWIGVLLLLTIPLVNIYFVIYWAFVQKISFTRRNFARAVLLWLLIVAMLSVLALIIFQPNFQRFTDAFKQSVNVQETVKDMLIFK